jgi:hypothetical protein
MFLQGSRPSGLATLRKFKVWGCPDTQSFFKAVCPDRTNPNLLLYHTFIRLSIGFLDFLLEFSGTTRPSEPNKSGPDPIDFVNITAFLK